MKTPALPETPITDETFERQGWRKHPALDYDGARDLFDQLDAELEDGDPYFWTLPLPKNRSDEYSPILISNDNDSDDEVISMGLKPGEYFIEIYDFDGLGFCTSEEDLEVLYYALTKKYIEE